MTLVIGWSDLVWLALGMLLGVAGLALWRRWKLMGIQCRFCLGKGYFASSAHESSVLDQVYQESVRFRP